MSYQTILVQLDGTPRDKVRLDIAAQIGAPDRSHLVGLFVIHPFYPSLGTFGDPAAGVVADLQRQYREDAAKTAETVQAAAVKVASDADLPFEWRAVEGFAEDVVPVHARYADLNILGQPDPDSSEPGVNRSLAVLTVMNAGRPVLTVPYAGQFATLGENVLVAWNGSREAARSVHDAMPLLKVAKTVSVLSVNPQADNHIAGFDISAQLARHGVNTEAVRTVSDDVSVGDLLLSEAADLGSDLIVMGGYGRSRLREFILGGVSQTLMSTMTVPVFMSH